MSMPSWTRSFCWEMTGERWQQCAARHVVIDFTKLSGEVIAKHMGCDITDLRPSVSSITMAELAAGPHATSDPAERAVRQARLQWAESAFRPLGFDLAAARYYGLIYAMVLNKGRKPGKRLADLLIASVAAANKLPLVTRNPDDFVGLENALTVIAV